MTEPQKYPRRFEIILKDDFCRLKVPGGWIVWMAGTQEGTALFISDPNHEWVLDDES